MVRPICGVQLSDGKKIKDLMLILVFNEIVDQLAMVSSVY